MAVPSAASISITTGPMSSLCGLPIPPAGRSRNAMTDPAAQATQPISPSTSPAPMRWVPPDITVPASAKKKPNVTMLMPSPSSAPIHSRVPPSRMSTALAAQAAR